MLFARKKSHDKSGDQKKSNFVAIFVFFGTAASFVFLIKFAPRVTEAKREAILFFFVSSEVNSYCYSSPS